MKPQILQNLINKLNFIRFFFQFVIKFIQFKYKFIKANISIQSLQIKQENLTCLKHMKNLRRKQSQTQSNNQDNKSQSQKRSITNALLNQSPYFDNNNNQTANKSLRFTPQKLTNFQSQTYERQQQQKLNQIAGIQKSNQKAGQKNLQPSMIQYKLQKLLHQSSKRQQMYQQFIKKKQQQSYQITEKYFKSLQKYKQQLDKYIEEKKNIKQKKFQKYTANKVLFSQHKPINKYQKVKLSSFNNQYENDTFSGGFNQRRKINLHCRISLVYYLPLLQDSLKENFPKNLDFQFFLPTRKKYLVNNIQKLRKKLQTSVELDQDESENIQNLIHEYPFNLIPCGNRNDKIVQPAQGDNMSYQFTLVNQQQNIELFQKGKIWVTITDRDSQIMYGYSSIPSEQLLYYASSSTAKNPIKQQWKQLVYFYSPFTHLKICRVSMKFQNEPSYFEQNSNKAQSSEPIELAKLNIQRSMFGDKQSRQIQRINKFKTTNTSLLMRPDPQYYAKQINQQKIFQSSNDKALIDHRKTKQIQMINKYKQQHRQQLTQKLFDQALERFSLQEIELGVPKYLIFYYEKQKSTPEKILLNVQIKLNEQVHISEDKFKQQISIQLVSKEIAAVLEEKGLIKKKQNCSMDIQGSMQEGIYIFQKRVALVIKVLIQPNQKIQQLVLSSQNHEKQKLKFDLSLKIQSQHGQTLSQQVYKLQPVKLGCQYELTYHNYQEEYQQISIPLNINKQLLQNQFKSQQSNTINNFSQSSLSMNKNIKIIASQNVQYRLQQQNDQLCLRVQYKKIKPPSNDLKTLTQTNNNSKIISIVLIDSGHNFVLAAYRIKLISYHKMIEILKYTLGKINKYKFQFCYDQQVSRQIQRFNKPNNILISRNQNNKLRRVAFYTSHPNQCVVNCHGKNQLLIQSNKTYEIQSIFQTFSMDNTEDRVIIHMIDVETGLVIKKWLLKIVKVVEDYRMTYQLKMSRNKPTVFKYQLKNPYSQECSFKLYCSNHSILQVPKTPIILYQKQQTSIELEICIKKEQISTEQLAKGICVIMRVEDSLEKNGWNELFKILVI